MFEMVMARVCAIACGHEDAIDLDRLRHDPLMKVAVGRCPITGAPLASQSTISRLENAPSKTEAVRLESPSGASAVVRPPTSWQGRLRLNQPRRRRGLGNAKPTLLPLHIPLHRLPRSRIRLQARRCGFLMATRKSL
jgi:hypothetical protein